MWDILLYLFLLALIVAWTWRGVTKDFNQPYRRTWISRVRVPATWYDPGDEITMEHANHGVADFQLGLGPCGLEVTRIDCGWNDNGATFYVSQHCSNGESKTFYYRREDITGRIEKTVESEMVNPKESK